MFNFGEVRRAQLAKTTLLTSTLPVDAPGIFSNLIKICLDANESGVRKATGSYRTYQSLVKLQSWFLDLRWKTCLQVELQPRFRHLE